MHCKSTLPSLLIPGNLVGWGLLASDTGCKQITSCYCLYHNQVVLPDLIQNECNLKLMLNKKIKKNHFSYNAYIKMSSAILIYFLLNITLWFFIRDDLTTTSLDKLRDTSEIQFQCISSTEISFRSFLLSLLASNMKPIWTLKNPRSCSVGSLIVFKSCSESSHKNLYYKKSNITSWRLRKVYSGFYRPIQINGKLVTFKVLAEHA